MNLMQKDVGFEICIVKKTPKYYWGEIFQMSPVTYVVTLMILNIVINEVTLIISVL